VFDSHATTMKLIVIITAIIVFQLIHLYFAVPNEK